MVEAHSNGIPPGKSKFCPCEKGFTLIELLATVGIIFILAMLLFPTAKNMLQTGQKAACLNSLRQLYIGARGFAADNENSIPWNSYSPATDSWEEGFWMTKASSYAGLDGQTLCCPAAGLSKSKGTVPGIGNNANYAMNDGPGSSPSGFTCYFSKADGKFYKNSNGSGSLSRPYRFTDVRNQSSTVLFFDAGSQSMYQNSAKSPTSSWSWVPGYSKNKGNNFYSLASVRKDAEYGRHNKTINFIRVDGSMGSETAEKFVNTASYWNVQIDQ